MNSSVDYSHDLEKMLHLHTSTEENGERLLAYYQLYKRANELQGDVVKCGLSPDNITAFALFRHFIVSNPHQKVIAFQKPTARLFFDKDDSNKGTLTLRKRTATSDTEVLRDKLKENKLQPDNFLDGNICETIPHHLIHNPEIKISLLNIDLDDYEATLTTLQYLYPRLVQGGLLVIDNYYKKEEDYRAVREYFWNTPVSINNFSLKHGPHYLIRQ